MIFCLTQRNRTSHRVLQHTVRNITEHKITCDTGISQNWDMLRHSGCHRKPKTREGIMSSLAAAAGRCAGIACRAIEAFPGFLLKGTMGLYTGVPFKGTVGFYNTLNYHNLIFCGVGFPLTVIWGFVTGFPLWV